MRILHTLFLFVPPFHHALVSAGLCDGRIEFFHYTPVGVRLRIDVSDNSCQKHFDGLKERKNIQNPRILFFIEFITLVAKA
jgi:hypothetical protein